eukprot:1924531-Prymnesium_polylepis.2
MGPPEQARAELLYCCCTEHARREVLSRSDRAHAATQPHIAHTHSKPARNLHFQLVHNFKKAQNRQVSCGSQNRPRSTSGHNLAMTLALALLLSAHGLPHAISGPPAHTNHLLPTKLAASASADSVSAEGTEADDPFNEANMCAPHRPLTRGGVPGAPARRLAR